MPVQMFDILPEFFKHHFDELRALRTERWKWALLDFTWRRQRYGRRIPQKKGRDRFFWQKKGWRSGQPPNLFFDSAYYFKKMEEAHFPEEGSIFAFYLKQGLANIAPHWLFSEEDYGFFNKDVSKADFTFDLADFVAKSQEKKNLFLNFYDHFCMEGDRDGRRPHRFFSPEFFWESLGKQEALFDDMPSSGAWEIFLSHFDPAVTSLRTSWYFDPKWYLQTYPEIAEKIAKNIYSSPLHHYLTNDAPLTFNPCAFFSEETYLSLHPDVHEAIQSGNFRNGYDHFIRCGQAEGRSFLIDPDGYPRNIFYFIEPSQEADAAMKNLKADDLFSLYVACQHLEKDLTSFPRNSAIEAEKARRSLEDSGQVMHLAQLRQEALFSVLSRSPLQIFTEACPAVRPPDLSVVLFSHGDYAALISSIESMASFLGQGTELLIVTSGIAKEEEIVRNMVKGEMRFIRLLKTEPVLSFWEAALDHLQGKTALWLESGMRLACGDFSDMRVFPAEKEIAAVGACVKAGLQYRFGGNLAADGTLLSQDASYLRQDYLFQGRQEIDLPAEGVLLFDPVPVRELWQKISASQRMKDRITGTALSDFETIALSLRENGRKIMFAPDFYAASEGKLSFPKAEGLLARWRRRIFPKIFLSEKTENITFIFDKMPVSSPDGVEEAFVKQVKYLMEAGFSIHFLARFKEKASLCERFLHFGSAISWEEAPEDWESALLNIFKTSDLVWLAGIGGLESVMDYRTESSPASQPYCPCLLDLRFEQKNGTLLEKVHLDALAENRLIEAVILDRPDDALFLDQLPELLQIILPLGALQDTAAILSGIEKLRFIFESSRPVMDLQAEKENLPLGEEKNKKLYAKRLLKPSTLFEK